MKRTRAGIVVAAAIVATLSGFVHGSAPDVPTGQWAAGPALAQPRTDAVSVGLEDGRVLVIGGRTADGPVATVEIYSTTGDVVAGASLAQPRSGHTAVRLPDGRVLVAGGTTLVATETGTAEAPAASVEIFDPGAGAWYAAGPLLTARTGHTATALADGRVLVAGGTGDAGALDTIEIFDPASGTFLPFGIMSAARAQHGAAAVGATRVLLAGGRNAQGVLGSADLVDVDTGVVATIALTSPRTGASVTRLLDGTVLVIGGNDGATDLGTGEVIDPAAGTSSALGATMAQPRRNAQAVLLDHNNSVLITGGTAGGALVTSAEQFLPWTHQFRATSSPVAARSGATLRSLPQAPTGLALLAGGAGADGARVAGSELYGFATVKTDKDDYAPGELVTITGTGWQPGETVRLTLVEEPLVDEHPPLEAVADAWGNIRSASWAPDEQDLNIRFYLTARGAASEAQTTFTDGLNVRIDSATLAWHRTGEAAGGFDVPVAGTYTCTRGGQNSCTVVNAITIAVPSVIGSKAITGLANSANSEPWNTTLQFRTSGGDFVIPTADGQYSVTATLGTNLLDQSVSTTYFGVDNTPPVTSVFCNGNNIPCAGTYAANVTIRLNDVDPGADKTFSGVAPSNGAVDYCVDATNSCVPGPDYPGGNGFIVPYAAGTTRYVRFRSTDNVGNVEATKSQAIVFTAVDSTPPSIVPTVTGTAGTNGWYTSDVAVSWTVTDPESTVSGSNGCTPTNLTAETGGTTLTCQATSAGGTSSESVTVKIDKSAPSAALGVTAGTAGSNGWYTSDVTIHASGTDPLSGPVTCTADQFQAVETTGAVFNASCTNAAGLMANAAPVTVKLDKTAPSATLAVTAGTLGSNGWYVSNVTVHASGSDSISSPVTCTADQSQTSDTTSQAFNGSCTNNAGLSTNATALTVKLDKTAPVVTGTADRAADHNGWYNHAVTITWTGTDGFSGIASCDAATSFSGPDTATANPSGTCTDQAGNPGTGSLSFKYDGAAPSATLAVTAGAAGANGWYTNDVTVHTSGDDAISGIAACSVDQYQAAETAGTAFNGSCTDGAGLTGHAAPLTIKLDKTGPTATLAVTAGTLGSNGWYTSDLTIGASGSDTISSPVTCTADQFQMTDTPGQAFNGSCTNDAGLSTNAPALTVKLDKTAPVVTGTADRAADHNGWYNHALTITWDGTDGVSGIAGCHAATGYSGPDTTAASPSGTCTDEAGNVGSGSLSFKYDGTAPAATLAVTAGTPGSNGWYTSDVTVGTSGTDDVSGPVSCTAGQSQTTETTGETFNGSCTNDAGLSTNAAPLTVKVDKTGPSATLAVTAGTLGSNGWYKSDITIGTSGSDSISSPVTCTADQSQTSDTTSQAFNGSCTNNAGLSTDAAPLTVRLDKTAPTLAPSVTPTTVVLNGSASAAAHASDATSGVATQSCAAVATAAVGSLSVTCSATDTAGNTATAPAAYSVVYATGTACLGSEGHQILQPINWDASSVFKQKSTVPAKFRVCDANGVSIGTAGVVNSFNMVNRSNAAPGEVVNEPVDSTTPDVYFRWSPIDQQWIFNISTKPLQVGVRYFYRISLNDGTFVDFAFALK